jgi:hypothetical protein
MRAEQLRARSKQNHANVETSAAQAAQAMTVRDPGSKSDA